MPRCPEAGVRLELGLELASAATFQAVAQLGSWEDIQQTLNETQARV